MQDNSPQKKQSRELLEVSLKIRFLLGILISIFAIGGQCYEAKAQGTFTIGVVITEGTIPNQGPPISGASVVLVMNGTTQITLQTDSNGTCSFTGISGSYDVTPSKPNYVFQPPTQGGSNTGPRTLFFTGTLSGGPTVQLNAPSYSVGEGNGSVAVTVVRGGSTSAPASVSYATNDPAGLTNCNVFNN